MSPAVEVEALPFGFGQGPGFGIFPSIPSHDKVAYWNQVRAINPLHIFIEKGNMPGSGKGTSRRGKPAKIHPAYQIVEPGAMKPRPQEDMLPLTG